MRTAFTLLMSFAIGLPAVELVRRDLCLAVEALPAQFDYELDSPQGVATGTDEFDRALGIRLGGRWSFSQPGAVGSLVAGLDLRLGDAVYGEDGTYRTFGLGASLGYSRSFGRHWTGYAEPVVELGWATLDFAATSAAPAVSADGRHTLYGLRLGALYAISPRWLIDANLGYLVIASDTTADDVTFSIDQRGFAVGFGVVWRFSDAPARLE